MLISSFKGKKLAGTEVEIGLVTKFRVIALKIKLRKASFSDVTYDWDFHDLTITMILCPQVCLH